MDNQNQKKRSKRPFRYRKNQNKKAAQSPLPPQSEEKLTEDKSKAAENTLPLSEEGMSCPTEETVQEHQENESPYEVVGVRFRPVGKTYSFSPQDLPLKLGQEVIVETSQGLEFGTIATPIRTVSEKEVVLPLKKVVRIATEKDRKRNEENRELELRAKKVFLEKTKEHELDMALSDVECSFDNSKLIFYFTSEGRVDFREFVKDMASVFKTRIELRQIGVRDEAKQLGGLGICGRPLCCSTFLEDFQQVSIKMAKEQNLSLNPTKISGTCGRLMCCLRYENDVYVEAGKKCPKADCPVMTPQGKGTVVEANVLCGRCKVKLDSDPANVLVYSAEELKALPKQKKNTNFSKEKKEAEKKQTEN